MSHYHVHRSTTIQATPERVFDTVADYGTWTKWSPWLGIDSEAKVTVSDDPSSVGSRYQWVGEYVGQGEIEHIQLDRPSVIRDEIRIIKPFRSNAKVAFDVESLGNGATQITWHMQGKLPWFLFWMKRNMETFIGMDYERGLRKLRDFIETGTVHSKIEVCGTETTRAITVLGVRDKGPLDHIGPVMKKAVDRATLLMKQNGLSTDGTMVTVYHPTSLSSGQLDFTAGYQVDASTRTPAELNRVELPVSEALHIRHIGSYDHLGNAWSGAHQYARYAKLKLSHKRDCYEIYGNDPDTTPQEDLITDLFLPLR